MPGEAAQHDRRPRPGDPLRELLHRRRRSARLRARRPPLHEEPDRKRRRRERDPQNHHRKHPGHAQLLRRPGQLPPAQPGVRKASRLVGGGGRDHGPDGRLLSGPADTAGGVGVHAERRTRMERASGDHPVGHGAGEPVGQQTADRRLPDRDRHRHPGQEGGGAGSAAQRGPACRGRGGLRIRRVRAHRAPGGVLLRQPPVRRNPGIHGGAARPRPEGADDPRHRVRLHPKNPPPYSVRTMYRSPLREEDGLTADRRQERRRPAEVRRWNDVTACR